MSLQTTSGRHRAVRNREHWLRLRRLTRLVAQFRSYLTTRPQLLAASPYGDVRVVHYERASIGYYQPRTVPTDRVKVVDAASELFGGIGFIAKFVNVRQPIIVSLPVRQAAGGHRFEDRPFSAAQIAPVVELDRSMADTLVMDGAR